MGGDSAEQKFRVSNLNILHVPWTGHTHSVLFFTIDNLPPRHAPCPTCQTRSAVLFGELPTPPIEILDIEVVPECDTPAHVPARVHSNGRPDPSHIPGAGFHGRNVDIGCERKHLREQIVEEEVEVWRHVFPFAPYLTVITGTGGVPGNNHPLRMIMFLFPPFVYVFHLFLQVCAMNILNLAAIPRKRSHGTARRYPLLDGSPRHVV